MTERRALELASGIVRQHNLLSTATDEEIKQTLSRLISWWNFVAFPALDYTANLPAWLLAEKDRIIADLTTHCRYPERKETDHG